MSLRRLVVTAACMGLVAVVLDALTPGLPAMVGALASAQRTADTVGPDSLVEQSASRAHLQLRYRA